MSRLPRLPRPSRLARRSQNRTPLSLTDLPRLPGRAAAAFLLLPLALLACGGGDGAIGSSTSDEGNAALTVRPGPWPPPTLCGSAAGVVACSGNAPCQAGLVDIGGTCQPCGAMSFSAVASAPNPEAVEFSFGENKSVPISVTIRNTKAPYDSQSAVVTANGANVGDWIFPNTWPSTTYTVTANAAHSTCPAWTATVATPIETFILSSGEMNVTNGNGWAQLAITSAGDYSYRGYVQNSGFLAENYVFGAAVGWLDPWTGKYAGFPASGYLDGTSDPFSSHSNTWQTDGTSSDIAKDWLDVRSAINSGNSNFTLQVNNSPMDVLGSIGEIVLGGGVVAAVVGVALFLGSSDTHARWLPPEEGGGVIFEHP